MPSNCRAPPEFAKDRPRPDADTARKSSFSPSLYPIRSPPENDSVRAPRSQYGMRISRAASRRASSKASARTEAAAAGRPVWKARMPAQAAPSAAVPATLRSRTAAKASIDVEPESRLDRPGGEFHPDSGRLVPLSDERGCPLQAFPGGAKAEPDSGQHRRGDEGGEQDRDESVQKGIALSPPTTGHRRRSLPPPRDRPRPASGCRREARIFPGRCTRRARPRGHSAPFC